MQKKTTVFIYAILIVSIISGCSAKNKNQNVAKGDASVQAANQNDITRPPEFVKRERDDAEGDPEETISLDEWQKKQEAKQ